MLTARGVQMAGDKADRPENRLSRCQRSALDILLAAARTMKAPLRVAGTVAALAAAAVPAAERLDLGGSGFNVAADAAGGPSRVDSDSGVSNKLAASSESSSTPAAVSRGDASAFDDACASSVPDGRGEVFLSSFDADMEATKALLEFDGRASGLVSGAIDVLQAAASQEELLAGIERNPPIHLRHLRLAAENLHQTLARLTRDELTFVHLWCGLRALERCRRELPLGSTGRSVLEIYSHIAAEMLRNFSFDSGSEYVGTAAAEDAFACALAAWDDRHEVRDCRADAARPSTRLAASLSPRSLRLDRVLVQPAAEYAPRPGARRRQLRLMRLQDPHDRLPQECRALAALVRVDEQCFGGRSEVELRLLEGRSDGTFEADLDDTAAGAGAARTPGGLIRKAKLVGIIYSLDSEDPAKGCD